MIRKNLKRSTTYIVIATFSISMFLSGCGKNTDDFTEYGTNVEVSDTDGGEDSGTNKVDASENDAENVTSNKLIGDSKSGMLSDKLGGKELEYSKDFSIGGKPADINVKLQVFHAQVLSQGQ